MLFLQIGVLPIDTIRLGGVVVANHIESLVEEIVINLLNNTNIELIDVEYVKEKDWYLRVFIDKDGGIEIEDCQSLSEQLEEKLDELDPISDSYYLEVSSPGLDRALKKDKDFQRHLGDKIEITTYAPINGSKIIVGTLKQYSAENLTIEVEENIISIEREKIAKVKLYLDF